MLHAQCSVSSAKSRCALTWKRPFLTLAGGLGTFRNASEAIGRWEPSKSTSSSAWSRVKKSACRSRWSRSQIKPCVQLSGMLAKSVKKLLKRLQRLTTKLASTLTSQFSLLGETKSTSYVQTALKICLLAITIHGSNRVVYPLWKRSITTLRTKKSHWRCSYCKPVATVESDTSTTWTRRRMKLTSPQSRTTQYRVAAHASSLPRSLTRQSAKLMQELVLRSAKTTLSTPS